MEIKNKENKIFGRKFTALAGTLFLVWLFFSPIFALLLLSKFFQDFNIYAVAIAVPLMYIVLGMVYYRICHYFGGVYKKTNDKMVYLEEGEIKPEPYRGLLEMTIITGMVFAGGYVIKIGATSPLLFGLLGLVIFVFTCFANWYPPLRKKVNYWLSFGEKNKAVAYARAESTLYALNGLLIVISGFLMITASLFLFPSNVPEHRNIQSIYLEETNISYILYDDRGCGGFGDPGWQVFEVNNSISPTKPTITCDINTTQIGNKGEGIKLILTNYSEDGSDTNDPYIEVLNKQYVIFSRGGLYYGLYDIETETTLVNIWSPWHEYYREGIGSYSEWVQTNLHSKIKKLIQ